MVLSWHFVKTLSAASSSFYLQSHWDHHLGADCISDGICVAQLEMVDYEKSIIKAQKK